MGDLRLLSPQEIVERAKIEGRITEVEYLMKALPRRGYFPLLAYESAFLRMMEQRIQRLRKEVDGG